MTGILAILAALPWRKIGVALAGAVVLGFLAAPWILWQGAKKDTAAAVARAELAESNLERANAIATVAIENRKRIETALDDISAATKTLAETAGAAVTAAENAGIRAREIAKARAELAELRIQDAEFRRRTESLDYCQTLELVVQSIAED